MAKFIDLSGQRFGHVTAVHRSEHTDRPRWVCRCDCGASFTTRAELLKAGRTKSCGCRKGELVSARVTRHGHASGEGSREYASWRSMNARCGQKSMPNYARYGGAGVTVCQRWRDDFANFLADLGPRPVGMTLDRFPDKTGHYEPGNCRWATPADQSQNLRNNVIVEVAGEQMTIRQASERYALPYDKLRRTLSRLGEWHVGAWRVTVVN